MTLSTFSRQLAHNKLANTTLIALIALGIGANTLIFSFVYSILLRPLAVQNPDCLFRLEKNRSQQVRPDTYSNYGEFTALARRTDLFNGLLAEILLPYSGLYPLSAGNAATKLVRVKAVTEGFFPDLGVHPMIGNLFAASGEEGANANSLVASFAFWRAVLGSDPHALGRTIRISDHPFTIAGVLDSSFRGLDLDALSDVYVPAASYAVLVGRALAPASLAFVYGRLKPGVSRAGAEQTSEPITREAALSILASNGDADPASTREWLEHYQLAFDRSAAEFRSSASSSGPG